MPTGKGTDVLTVEASADELERWRAVARRDGLPVERWAVRVLRREADRPPPRALDRREVRPDPKPGSAKKEAKR